MVTTTGTTRPLRRAMSHLPAIHWHRPLLWLAATMVVLALGAAVGMIVDPRELTGAPLWAKPFKFALSTLIYSITLAWLVGQLRRGRRVAWWAGTVAAFFLAVELVIIFGVAASGTTSHFNVSSDFATTLWSTMAASIVIIWVSTMLVGLLLFFADLGDAARSVAIRSGVILAVIGMGLGFLMTQPTAAQLDDFQGIAGAHTVGLDDGGPGLPLLGWSTVAGDLRIPHFIGMHALQLLPIAAIVLELAARRVPLLRAPRTRHLLVWVAVALYGAVLAILTLQALGGQSIVQPSAPVIIATLTAFAAAGLLATIILAAAKRAQGAESPSVTKATL